MANAKERVTVIRECIEYKDPVGVKKLILEDKFNDESYLWELVTLLGDCLTADNFEQCQGFFEVCETCLNYIIGVGNAAELLLALLEQADSFSDIVKFQTFLQIIQKTLLSLTARQQFSLELSLETLSDCIKTLELPKDLDLEEEERRAHDLDPDVDKINKYVAAYLEFLKPFAEQVACGKEGNYRGKNFQRQVDGLVKCLLNILDHPLVYLNLAESDEDETRRIRSDSRLCVEKLMQLLLLMYPNTEEIIKKYVEHNKQLSRLQRRKKLLRSKENGAVDSMTDDESLERMSLLALSCLAYLIHHEQLTSVMYPCLFIPQGIMEKNLTFVLTMLQQRESEVQRKGVLLLQTLVGMQTDLTSLTCEDLDRPEYFKILDALFNIMIHCSVKDIRQKCLQQVPVYIAMFSTEARYRIFTKLFATLKHPGAYGFCIQLFKTQLEEILSIEDITVKQSSQFLNVGLNRIFNLITSLSEGAATDFVENSDRIISVLNLCRFIVLRDPPNKNQTGFWSFYEKLEKNFLSQLQIGVEMATAHYKLELTGIMDGKQSETDIDMSVSVAGFKMPKMDRGQKIEIYKQAMNTLDLISSLFGRLSELVNQQKRQSKSECKH